MVQSFREFRSNERSSCYLLVPPTTQRFSSFQAFNQTWRVKVSLPTNESILDNFLLNERDIEITEMRKFWMIKFKDFPKMGPSICTLIDKRWWIRCWVCSGDIWSGAVWPLTDRIIDKNVRENEMARFVPFIRKFNRTPLNKRGMFELYAKVITFSSKFYFRDDAKSIKCNFDRNNLILLNKSLFLTTIFFYSKDILIRINIRRVIIWMGKL